MSKAVLVMDMPERCWDCPLCTEYEECLAVGIASIEVDALLLKPDWCPLRPLPARKKERESDSVLIKGMVRGWNDCLDAIGGGQE